MAQKKEKLKGVKYWEGKLWPVFSKYIRLRDAITTTGGTRDDEGDILADCITCYARKKIKHMDAGHWISRGRKSVKYDEHNVHAQCKQCNGYYGGEPQFYEDRIIELYGEAERDRLRQEIYKSRKFTPMELEEMYHQYKSKVEDLEATVA